MNTKELTITQIVKKIREAGYTVEVVKFSAQASGMYGGKVREYKEYIVRDANNNVIRHEYSNDIGWWKDRLHSLVW